MGAKFSSIFRIPWSHQSTSLSYLTFKNTVFIHYINQHYHEIPSRIDYPQKSPPPPIEFQSFHSTSDLTLENLRQVSPLHCLYVCYICLSVSLFVHVSIYTTQIASHFGQQNSICFVCLSISVSVCLSLYVCIFFNAAADCITRFDFGQHNIGVLLFCLSVCLLVVMITHFVGSQSSPTLSEVFPRHHP